MPLWRKQPGEPPAETTATPETEPEAERYEGPRCYVCHDQYVENRDGSYTRIWEAGWHYSTRVDELGQEQPHRKLHLNDSHSNEREWFYEYAQPHHRSWAEKHGPGDKVPLQRLPEGETHPPQAFDTHELHADWQRATTAQNPKKKVA